jgi:putative FmdB family regulatory protein
MPIYEFYCAHCHRVFNFLSRTVDTGKRPACPRCGGPDLARRVSAFAISKGRKEEPAPAGPQPGLDAARMERAMEALAAEAEGLNEDDPRQSARLMRKLFSATGMPVAGRMEEALRRLEAGENPEKVEEEMGDVLDADPFAGAQGEDAGEPGGARSTRALVRRLLPPSVDPELYEM